MSCCVEEERLTGAARGLLSPGESAHRQTQLGTDWHDNSTVKPGIVST